MAFEDTIPVVYEKKKVTTPFSARKEKKSAFISLSRTCTYVYIVVDRYNRYTLDVVEIPEEARNRVLFSVFTKAVILCR